MGRRKKKTKKKKRGGMNSVEELLALTRSRPVGTPRIVRLEERLEQEQEQKKLEQDQLDFLSGIDLGIFPDETISRNRLPDETLLHILDHGLLTRIGESVKIERYDRELRKAIDRTERMIQAFLNSIDLDKILNTTHKNYDDFNEKLKHPGFNLRWNNYLDRIDLPSNIKVFTDQIIEMFELDVDPRYGNDNNWGEFILQLRGWDEYMNYSNNIRSNQIIFDFVKELRHTIKHNSDYNELETEQYIQIFLSHIIL